MKKKTDANKKSLPQSKLPNEITNDKESKLPKETVKGKESKLPNETARGKGSKLLADKPKPLEEEKKSSKSLPDLMESFRKRPQY